MEKGASTPGRRKFSKQFKEEVAQRAESGTPVKVLARAYNINPDVVREWRNEFRELGLDAFTRTGKRRFTKEFKEAAVQRVEQGASLKEVARSCLITPVLLRQWRSKLRTLGANAFLKRKRRDKIAIIPLTEEEHARLRVLAKAHGARSLSDFARSQLLR